MEYRRLGRTALRVSPICLGTMNFGPLTTEADAHHIMDRAHEHGINFFDTANRYGGPKAAGTHGDDPRHVVRAGRRPPREDRARNQGLRPDDRVAERRAAVGTPHPRRVRREPASACRPTTSTCTRCITSTAARRGTRCGRRWRRSSSRARSSTSAAATSRAGTSCRRTKRPSRRNFLGLVSEQSLYNLAARTIELEVLPACRAYGVGVIPWSPLAGGMLGGTATSGDTARRKQTQPR